jgi:predicted DsbA family dithiol-disulfide isomerase
MSVHAGTDRVSTAQGPLVRRDRQKALEDDDLRSYADETGLDLPRFDRDRADADVLARIARDVASAEASGVVRGTPTLFIDGVLHRGGYDTAALLEALAR